MSDLVLPITIIEIQIAKQATLNTRLNTTLNFLFMSSIFKGMIQNKGLSVPKTCLDARYYRGSSVNAGSVNANSLNTIVQKGPIRFILREFCVDSSLNPHLFSC